MSHRSGNGAETLYALADEADSLRRRLPTSPLPDHPLGLVAASHQLRAARALHARLSEEVLFRIVDAARPVSREHRRLVGALSSAAASAGRALQGLTEVYEQLGFLYRFADHPDSPDLRDARQAAGRVIEDRLDEAREALLETELTLRRASEDLLTPSPHTTAARSRTTTDAPVAAPRPTATPPAARPTDIPAARLGR